MKSLLLFLLLVSPIFALTIQTDGTTITIGNESSSFVTVQSLKLSGSTSSMLLEGKANIFTSSPAKVPLIGSNGMAVDSLKVNGKDAQVFFENKTYFFLASSGSVDFTARLSPKPIKNSLNLFFRGPVVRLSIELDILGDPSRYINILAPIDSSKSYSKGSTHLSADFFGLESEAIPIQWEERINQPTPVSALEEVFATSFSDFQVSERQVTANHYIDYTAYNKKMSSLRVRTFGRVLSVNQDNWEVVQENGANYLLVSLKEPVPSVSLQYTEYIGQTGDFTAYPSVPEGAKTNLWVSIQSEPQLAISSSPSSCREVDVSDLPRRTAVFLKQLAFTCEPEGQIKVSVTPLKTVPVVTAASDYATYSLLSLESGGLLADLQWSVKSSAKDFMVVDIPEKAVILYAAVDYEPIKPTVSEGKLLLPLKRSNYGVPMELVYYYPEKELGLFGSIPLPLVGSDVPISNLNIQSFIPSKLFYLYSSTNLSRSSDYDWPAWRSILSTLVFLAVVSLFVSYSAVQKEHAPRFAFLCTITLYLLFIFHTGLFALVAGISVLYAARTHISLAQAKPILAALAILAGLALLWLFVSSVPIGVPMLASSESFATKGAMAPDVVSKRLESLSVLEGGVTVPMKQDVLPVKVEVPRSGKQVSFTKEFQTIDSKPQATIYYASDYLMIPLYLLALIFLYASFRQFRAYRIESSERRK